MHHDVSSYLLLRDSSVNPSKRSCKYFIIDLNRCRCAAKFAKVAHQIIERSVTVSRISVANCSDKHTFLTHYRIRRYSAHFTGCPDQSPGSSAQQWPGTSSRMLVVVFRPYLRPHHLDARLDGCSLLGDVLCVACGVLLSTIEHHSPSQVLLFDIDEIESLLVRKLHVETHPNVHKHT